MRKRYYIFDHASGKYYRGIQEGDEEAELWTSDIEDAFSTNDKKAIKGGITKNYTYYPDLDILHPNFDIPPEIELAAIDIWNHGCKSYILEVKVMYVH